MKTPRFIETIVNAIGEISKTEALDAIDREFAALRESAPPAPPRLLELAREIEQQWQRVVVPMDAPGVHQMGVLIARLETALRGVAASSPEPPKKKKIGRDNG